MTTATTQVAALVCSEALEMAVVPVVVSDSGDADAILDRAVTAAGLAKNSGVVVAVYEDGVDEAPSFTRVWDASYGGVWATLHPDAFDVPAWPGLTL